MDNKCSVDECIYPQHCRELCVRHYRRQIHSERGECSVEGCNTRWHSSGLCVKHYSRMRSWGTTDDPEPLSLRGSCSVEGCNDAVKARKLCGMHLQRWYRFGDVNATRQIRSRICKFCKQDILPGEVPLSRASVCKNCLPLYRAERNNERLKPTPELRKLKEELRVLQGYRCAICRIHEKDAPKGRLYLDHSHVTKEPRKLLCGNCNSGLGHFRDNPELLIAAANYLAASASGVPSGL